MLSILALIGIVLFITVAGLALKTETVIDHSYLTVEESKPVQIEAETVANLAGLKLEEPEPVKIEKISLTSAIRMSLARIGPADVKVLHYGVATAGISASKTKIRRQLRLLRRSGSIILNPGRQYELAA